MTKYKFNGLTLEMYDSIQELPILRFQMFNLNAMLDAGIGSDLSAYNNHCNKVVRFIDLEDKESAKREIQNKNQNLHFIMMNVSPEYNCFAAMIYKINGREILDSDLLGDGVQNIMAELSAKRFSIKKFRNVLSGIKKKIEFETSQFFPNLVDQTNAKVVYGKLKIRTDLLLEGIQKGFEKVDEQIRELDNFILSVNKPNKYTGVDGLEVSMIKNFESTCTLFQYHRLSNNPKKLTTLSFLEKTAALKEILKNLKKK